jgi:predicted DNA-binding protein
MLTGDMPLKRTNIWLKQTHLDRLKAVSRRTLVPVSALIRRAIETYLASLEKPQKKKSKAKQ